MALYYYTGKGISRQSTATSAEVTPNGGLVTPFSRGTVIYAEKVCVKSGGLVRESPQNARVCMLNEPQRR